MAEVASDVIVVGGGVAGLAAAGALARRRLRVTLLEARERLGGRVWTLQRPGWPGPIELGAEFVHAGNAAFWRLLRRHRLATSRVPATHWRFASGQLAPIADVTRALQHVTNAIAPRQMAGWSFARFLAEKKDAFPPADAELAAGFVEGFEAAPIERMSAVAMAGESLDTCEQFVVTGGYRRVIDALVRDLDPKHVRVCYRAAARRITWSRQAIAVATKRRVFTARALVLAVPLGVLQAPVRRSGGIALVPALAQKDALIAQMGMGEVLRLSLRFDPAQWAVIVPFALQRRRGGFGFVHSRVHGVPVWWALTPEPVLTGWAGGPAAVALAGISPARRCARAIGSLSEILGTPRRVLERALGDFATHNWSRDPFSRGAYSYAVAGLDDAAQRLREPVENTIFFAGEATADGDEIGTVHGAHSSGLRAAEEVVAALK